MADVLLVNAPLDRETREFSVVDNLGLMSLRACIERAGYSCDLLDSYREIWSYNEFIDRLWANPPTVYIGFSAGSANISNTVNTIQKLKKDGLKIHITMGGIWASYKHRILLNKYHDIDSIVVGEGEETAVYLAEALHANKDWASIPGLASRNKEGRISLIRRRATVDIDSLPFSDRTPYVSRIKQKKVQSIEFNRGCSGLCKFCNYSDDLRLTGMKGRRSRNPSRVVDEIEQIMRQTEINRFAFLDMDFIGFSKAERERCRSFAREIIKRGLDINFCIETQGKNIDYELFILLREAGLSRVNIGIESWADSQLQRYGKASTRKDNYKAVDTLMKLNIPFFGYLIPIDPFVQKEEIKATLKEIERIGLNTVLDVDFSKKMLLHRDSHFYEICKKYNLIGNGSPYDLTISSIPYSQRNRDVEEIVKIADVINDIFHPVRNKLEKTGWEKKLPTIWNAFSDDILFLLKEKCFNWFKDFSENAGDQSAGSETFSSKLGLVYEEVSKVCSEVTKDKLENFQNFAVRVDGEEVSTRLKETYVVCVSGK